MSEVILNTSHNSTDIRLLYDKYAGMLLGFIRGTVQDQQKSEEFLIKILSAYVKENKSNDSSWLSLRQYAKVKLADTFYDTKEKLNNPSANSLSDVLNADENLVFHAIYYYGQSITHLSASLNRDENTIRTQLKSSIDKIRKARGN